MVYEDPAGLEKKLRDEVCLPSFSVSPLLGFKDPPPALVLSWSQPPVAVCGSAVADVWVSDGAPDSLAASHSWLLILISWAVEPVGGGYRDQLGGGERDDFQVVTTC